MFIKQGVDCCCTILSCTYGK